jgi:hypothetical protein
MCGLRRELPLGEAFNEWERAFAERIPTLGEDPESISGKWIAKRPFVKDMLDAIVAVPDTSYSSNNLLFKASMNG